MLRPAFCLLVFLVIPVALSAQGPAPLLPAPLAASIAPECSIHPGIRAIRSDLIQFGEVTASISAQATRENGACLQNASLWVTKKDVSQQFDLRDAAKNSFAILDISPNASSILLTAEPAILAPDDYRPQQIAVLSLPDGSLRWTPASDAVGLRNCDASFDTQGFLDATHILIAVFPLSTAHRRPGCVTHPAYYQLDIVSQAVKPSALSGTRRFAKAVAPPVRSCKTDPDIIGACYTTRARLAVADKGSGLVVWPVGSKHLMSVEEDLLPDDLGSLVSPTSRVYATMVLCPLAAIPPKWRPTVCVDGATSFHVENPPKGAADVPPLAPAGSPTGEFH